MLTNLNRVIGLAGAIAIIGAGYVILNDADGAYIAPPARDALVQAVDLTRIAGFRYVDDHTLDVTDELGNEFKMALTAACPGLKDARTFSLVTENYRDFDRFTAIAVKGNVCTFKDFAPLAASGPSTPAS